jgi:hypothetical protein
VTLYNLVKVYTATTGQDDLVLGAAVPGFLTFAQASIPTGTTVSYGIKDGDYSEVGTGVYTSATSTLTRNVLASNDGGNKLFLSGLAEVFITVLAQDIPATTANLPDSTNKRYVTDANLTVIGNTSGVNTGDQTYTLIATLAGDAATSTNTNPVSLTGLVFTYAANSTYLIKIFALVSPTAATTGCGFQFDLSSAVTRIASIFFHQLANAGTLSGGHSIADDASVGVSSGMPANAGVYPVMLHAILVTGADVGTCQARFRSETTAVTTCKAGTLMIVEKVA